MHIYRHDGSDVTAGSRVAGQGAFVMRTGRSVFQKNGNRSLLYLPHMSRRIVVSPQDVRHPPRKHALLSNSGEPIHDFLTLPYESVRKYSRFIYLFLSTVTYCYILLN